MNKKKQKLPCSTKYCRKKCAIGRSRCESCRKREWEKKFPIKARFARLRGSAKKRGIKFTITLEYFTQWCERNSYHLKSGRTAGKLSVDRIDVSYGYEIGNLQVLTVSQNSLKYSFHDRYYRDPNNATHQDEVFESNLPPPPENRRIYHRI